MNPHILTDPWRVQLNMLNVRREYPDDKRAPDKAPAPARRKASRRQRDDVERQFIAALSHLGIGSATEVRRVLGDGVSENYVRRTLNQLEEAGQDRIRHGRT